jgi:hypothetical protein
MELARMTLKDMIGGGNTNKRESISRLIVKRLASCWRFAA